MKRRLTEFLLPIVLATSLTGCSTKMWKVAGVGLASGAAGAGVGYGFVHHGRNKENQTTNTIISASIFAVLGAGITYWHLTSLEEQRVELAGKFSRSEFLDRDSERPMGTISLPAPIKGGRSLRLDDDTRWVFPEFQRRELPSQRGESELISSHHTWEIARPGFFVTKDQDISLFKEEESHEGK